MLVLHPAHKNEILSTPLTKMMQRYHDEQDTLHANEAWRTRE